MRDPRLRPPFARHPPRPPARPEGSPDVDGSAPEDRPPRCLSRCERVLATRSGRSRGRARLLRARQPSVAPVPRQPDSGGVPMKHYAALDATLEPTAVRSQFCLRTVIGTTTAADPPSGALNCAMRARFTMQLTISPGMLPLGEASTFDTSPFGPTCNTSRTPPSASGYLSSPRS